MDKKYLVDSSSWLILARYYRPFDSDDLLSNKIESLYNSGSIILLDSVKDEISRISKGLVIKEFKFLENNKSEQYDPILTKTDHNRIDNNWCIRQIIKDRQLTDYDYQYLKETELKKADFQLLFKCMKLKEHGCIVTDESGQLNDGKPFKKIPAIARQEQLQCINIVSMLKECSLDIGFIVDEQEEAIPLTQQQLR
ncbi:DUF4411 family protein [Gammaproteobacteria bacterium]|nr:DUF4411 family protein [Gammaproteobacteria bacterium]